jgi:hypothetical protein
MKKALVLFTCLSALFLFGCKDKPGTETSGSDETVTASEMKNDADKEVSETAVNNVKWEERKQRGDTLAMPYKDLQQYLPEVPGYSSQGGPKGSQVNVPGMGSWSQTEQQFENGDKRLKISIFDYNSSRQAFVGLTSMYGMGFSFEDDTKKQAPVDLGKKDVSAYATIYKNEPKADMIMVVSDRFIVQVESEGENGEDFLKSVAGNIKLEELALK